MNNTTVCWLPPYHAVIRAQLARDGSLLPLGEDGVTPVSNTGGKSLDLPNDSPEKKKHCTSIDTLTFTVYTWAAFKSPAFHQNHSADENPECLSVPELYRFIGWLLSGVGIGLEPGRVPLSGHNAYRYRLALEDLNGIPCGAVNWGGESQNGTISINITGVGSACVNQRNGFDTLHGRLNQINDGGCHITRADVCWDDFEGEWSVTDVLKAYKHKMFNNGGRDPKSKMVGDWVGGESRTFYVGKRDSFCYWRSYEKGHEQGDMSSRWMRHEAEFKRQNKFMTVDLSILIEPDAWFAASYPKIACLMIDCAEPADIRKSVGGKVHLAFQHTVDTLKTQWGRHVRVMRDVAKFTPEKIIQLIISDDDKLPRRYAAAAVGDIGKAMRDELKKQYVPF